MAPWAGLGWSFTVTSVTEGEGPLRSHDELGEVIAAGGLHELPARPDGLTAGEHDLQAEDVMAGDAVLHGAHAPCIGGHVAAERRARLAREDGVDEIVGAHRNIELFERHAGLDDGDMVGGVDLEDLVHALERHEDPARRRDGGPTEPGATPSSRDRQPVCVGDLQHGGNLGRTAGKDHRQRCHRCGCERLVMVVIGRDVVAAAHVRRSDRVGQLPDDVGYAVLGRHLEVTLRRSPRREPGELFVTQVHRSGRTVLFQMRHLRRTRNGHHDGRDLQQPRQGHLGGAGARPLGPPSRATPPGWARSPLAIGHHGMKPMVCSWQ